MLIPGQNGFVDTVIMAYTKHHALVLRPDDVWMMILLQFNFFVNANSEPLRAAFVQRQGKRKLLVKLSVGPPDFGAMARQKTNLIEENVVDPALREWVLPIFSTTTANDTTVSAILTMATLKQYFSFNCRTGCGLPRVTLEGERSDWVNILHRLEKLKEYRIETIAWYHLLHPVVSRFVAAFDFPESPDNVDFWQRVAKHEPGGSGSPSFYSGWITAFCVLNEKGEWIGNPLKMVRFD
jgi:hypothetical protein